MFHISIFDLFYVIFKKMLCPYCFSKLLSFQLFCLMGIQGELDFICQHSKDGKFEEYTRVNIEGLDCRMGLTVIRSKHASVCATVCPQRD